MTKKSQYEITDLQAELLSREVIRLIGAWGPENPVIEQTIERALSYFSKINQTTRRRVTEP
jgi:hypothetical protein